ncbi:hypothetical protein AMQ83_30725, partial [Paenibacillus riograndensis]
MGQPAAKKGDRILATDTHIVMLPAGPAPVPTPLPHPFTGILDGALSANVKIMGQPAATVDSTATNTPAHVPQGGPFQKPPTNQGKILAGRPSVTINVKMAARHSKPALTCNEQAELPVGKVEEAGRDD